MRMKILVQIVILSALAVGMGCFLSNFGVRSNDGYDERQQIERGKAAHAAMMTVVSYLIFFWGGLEMGLLEMEGAAVLAVWGMVLAMAVFNCYVIFRDAYLRQDQEPGPKILHCFAFGLIWLAMARGFRGDLDWMQLALAIDFLLEGLMLLIRTVHLKLQERRDSNG